MPFLNDIGQDDEVLQRPIWGVFALVKDNLERMLMTNIGWSLQLMPAIAALAFPQLPLVARVLLALYSAVMLTPATGILFVWMARVNQRETLRLEMLKEDFRTLALPSVLCLAPLFASLGLWYLLILLFGLAHVLLLDVLARFALIVLLMSAVYWGPLFAEYPDRSPLFLLRRSLLLVWRYPGTTLLTGLLALLIAGVGVLSIAGFFLIMPVVAALVLTRRSFILLAREDARLKRVKESRI